MTSSASHSHSHSHSSSRNLGRAADADARQDTWGSRDWGRGRLLTILVAAVAVALALIVALAYAVYLALSGLDNDSTSTDAVSVATGVTNHATVAQGGRHRDDIAAAPMLSVPASAAFPSDVGDDYGVTSDSRPTHAVITIPAGTGITGPGFVMTGFPHTPEGAIAQLAQVDTAVLQSMSLQTAQEVYASWALPGGVGADSWWITASVEAFLDTSEMGNVKSADASVVTEPAAALVKGTDGPDWATVCVLFKVTAVYRSEGQAAFGHCERMQWVGGRWMLAQGQPPVSAPATWPGTELAVEAGWRTWTADPSTGLSGEHSEHSEHGQHSVEPDDRSIGEEGGAQ